MYHYAGNNPVTYTDPDGNIAIPVVIGVGIFLYAVLKTYCDNINIGSNNYGFIEYSSPMMGNGGIFRMPKSNFGYSRTEFPLDFPKKSNITLANTSDIPSQGTIDGGVEGAPPVDAGKQGKHVPGHPNYNPNGEKSSWKDGTSGIPETQEGWLKGEVLPDGTRVWDSGKELGTNGQTGVRVHGDSKGNIHGYPVDPKQYLGE